MQNQCSQKDQKQPRPTYRELRAAMVAIWLRNPCGQVALDAAAVTLLSVACLMNEDINESLNWVDTPTAKDPSELNPDDYVIRNRRIAYDIYLCELLDSRSLHEAIDAVANSLRIILSIKPRPIKGSVKLVFIPSVTSERITPMLTYLATAKDKNGTRESTVLGYKTDARQPGSVTDQLATASAGI